jgi:hypothetical protein
MRASALALVAALCAASGAAAQSLSGALSSSHPFIPRTLDTSIAAPSRFQIIARQIDSASAVGERMQTEAAAREQSARMAGRALFLASMMQGLEHRRLDWVSAVTLAGVSQLGAFRGNGQFAGLGALAGGASWLLSNLRMYPRHFSAAPAARKRH